MLYRMISEIELRLFFLEGRLMLALQPKIIVFLLRPFYTVTAGMSWRKRYGDFKMVHTHHTRWSKGDVWKKVFEMLAEEANNEYSMIDSTIVRAHQHSAGAKKRFD